MIAAIFCAIALLSVVLMVRRCVAFISEVISGRGGTTAPDPYPDETLLSIAPALLDHGPFEVDTALQQLIDAIGSLDLQ